MGKKKKTEKAHVLDASCDAPRLASAEPAMGALERIRHAAQLCATSLDMHNFGSVCQFDAQPTVPEVIQAAFPDSDLHCKQYQDDLDTPGLHVLSLDDGTDARNIRSDAVSSSEICGVYDADWAVDVARSDACAVGEQEMLTLDDVPGAPCAAHGVLADLEKSTGHAHALGLPSAMTPCAQAIKEQVTTKNTFLHVPCHHSPRQRRSMSDPCIAAIAGDDHLKDGLDTLDTHGSSLAKTSRTRCGPSSDEGSRTQPGLLPRDPTPCGDSGSVSPQTSRTQHGPLPRDPFITSREHDDDEDHAFFDDPFNECDSFLDSSDERAYDPSGELSWNCTVGEDDSPCAPGITKVPLENYMTNEEFLAHYSPQSSRTQCGPSHEDPVKPSVQPGDAGARTFSPQTLRTQSGPLPQSSSSCDVSGIVSPQTSRTQCGHTMDYSAKHDEPQALRTQSGPLPRDPFSTSRAQLTVLENQMTDFTGGFKASLESIFKEMRMLHAEHDAAEQQRRRDIGDFMDSMS